MHVCTLAQKAPHDKQPHYVKYISLLHPSDNTYMEKNERGSALVSSLPCTALSHTLTVMAAEGYAVEFTLPGFSTCTRHKPKPCTFWEGLRVISTVLYFVHGFLVVTFCICSKGFFSVCMQDLPCCEIQERRKPI